VSTPSYALHDPQTGAWYYRMPRGGDEFQPARGGVQSVTVDGRPAEVVRGWVFVPALGGETYAADSEVAATYSGGSELTGWRLREQFRGAAMAETLTPDQMHELDEDGAEAAAYEAVFEPRPPVVVRESCPRVLLDGAPRPQHPGRWVADLPYELRHHQEFLHLFPGRLTGLWEVATERLKAVPGVTAFVDGHPAAYNARLKVGVTVALPPEARQPARGRRGTTKYRPAVTARQLWREVPSSELPDTVQAGSLAAALATFEPAVEALVAWARDARSGVWCTHCDGTGVLPGREDAQEAPHA